MAWNAWHPDSSLYSPGACISWLHSSSCHYCCAVLLVLVLFLLIVNVCFVGVVAPVCGQTQVAMRLLGSMYLGCVESNVL